MLVRRGSPSTFSGCLKGAEILVSLGVQQGPVRTGRSTSALRYVDGAYGVWYAVHLLLQEANSLVCRLMGLVGADWLGQLGVTSQVL